MSRDEIRFITLEYYNQLAGTEYSTITRLIYHPPSFEEEIKIRNQIVHTPFDLGAILVVESIPNKKIEVILDTKTYNDVKESLIELD